MHWETVTKGNKLREFLTPFQAMLYLDKNKIVGDVYRVMNDDTKVWTCSRKASGLWEVANETESSDEG